MDVIKQSSEIERHLSQLDPLTRSIIQGLQESLRQSELQIQKLHEELSQMRRMMFGQRSERLVPVEQEVRRVMSENELSAQEQATLSPEEKASKRRKSARAMSENERRLRKSKKMKDLPVLEAHVPVLLEELPEGMMRSDFREMGYHSVIKRIEHVPPHLLMVHYQLQTLVSKSDKHLVIHAKSPMGVSPGCQYGPSVHAHVVTAKCADSLPLYRIETMMEREGAPIARSTLCSMFHRSAECLEPIYKLIVEKAKASPYLHADETHFKVQGSPKCHKGWMWLIASPDVVAYLYDNTRAQDVAKDLIGDAKGYLMIDGYAGYNAVTEDEGKRTRVGCWGHTRRKFFNALAHEPKAKTVLDLIRKLYEIEYKAAELGILGTNKHTLLRQSESKTIVDKIDAWVDEHENKLAPSLAIGKAITYEKNQRQRLRRFLDNPKIPLDNNFAERQLRIIAIGRKNYLFAGHKEGAQNLAILQSIVSTCKLQGINPYDYIKDVLVRTQNTKQKDIQTLAPWNWKPTPIKHPYGARPG